ncbi:hypothetical protein FNV43_RR19754 [Rhamnella rubrinervis]|uniref:Uncharacterized protein n=1 Tax=Rhamnella rubrinervis TaxID=2594499 RepID=A0A8K0DUN3_9ROSA|nr:hypothetical protein FNV43_RR19754 [Rhamnella rubrinervis]
MHNHNNIFIVKVLRRMVEKNINYGTLEITSSKGHYPETYSGKSEQLHNKRGMHQKRARNIIDNQEGQENLSRHGAIRSNDPKPSDIIWKENENCEEAFWRRYTQPQSFNMSILEAQGWRNDFERADKYKKLESSNGVTIDVVARVLYDEGKTQNNKESNMKSKANAQAATTNALQHNLKFKSFFYQLGYGRQVRIATTKVLMRISTDHGPQCYVNEAKSMRAFLETTYTITFTDEDMEAPYLDH